MTRCLQRKQFANGHIILSLQEYDVEKLRRRNVDANEITTLSNDVQQIRLGLKKTEKESKVDIR